MLAMLSHTANMAKNDHKRQVVVLSTDKYMLIFNVT